MKAIFDKQKNVCPIHTMGAYISRGDILSLNRTSNG